MRDYTSNNYCDFLWINDLLGLKQDANKAFVLEVKKGEVPNKITFSNLAIFGTIIEVKQVGDKEFLYQLDDGTGVIACKHSQRQFEEIISIIENEQMDILNQTLEFQQNSEQSYVTDTSADDSIFNDKSIQIEEINFNKKSRLRGLQSIWDDIYASFSSCIHPYSIGDSVAIEGKLYTYFNNNQIYINSIRKLEIQEEIMLTAVKLEDGLDQSAETKTVKTQPEAGKRQSGLLTFDSISHLDAKISVPRNIETPKGKMLDSTLEVVTPNIESTITFDTFTSTT